MSTVECCKFFFILLLSLSLTELSHSHLFIISQCGGGCLNNWIAVGCDCGCGCSYRLVTTNRVSPDFPYLSQD